METVDAPEQAKVPIFRDIRRYNCEYCGICRSKKSLIRSHVLADHKEEVDGTKVGEGTEGMDVSKNVQHICQECGATFRKPAYLIQHMQSHSLEVFMFDMVENKREAFGSRSKNSKMRIGCIFLP